MKTVLYYEDDPYLAAMYQAHLQLAGFSVVLHQHPNDPVAEATAIDPDLILMDTIMPTMDGFTATALLKDDPRTKSIPVFGLSNLGQRSDRVHALAVGMFDHWVSADHKPDEVVAKIKSLIGLS
jgi:CheY-like chemotaxis protein